MQVSGLRTPSRCLNESHFRGVRTEAQAHRQPRINREQTAEPRPSWATRAHARETTTLNSPGPLPPRFTVELITHVCIHTHTLPCSPCLAPLSNYCLSSINLTSLPPSIQRNEDTPCPQERPEPNLKVKNKPTPVFPQSVHKAVAKNSVEALGRVR